MVHQIPNKHSIKNPKFLAFFFYCQGNKKTMYNLSNTIGTNNNKIITKRYQFRHKTENHFIYS